MDAFGKKTDLMHTRESVFAQDIFTKSGKFRIEMAK